MAISRLRLFRNVGQFDSVDAAGQLPLGRLTLVYAENGRGKTTLASTLRSLSTGDPLPIAERRRLSAQHPPHVILECGGGPPPAIFENNAWNRALPDVLVFDDVFVDENVYSGLSVDPGHRQRLHELILGSQGVTLNQQVQQHAARIEEHNQALQALRELMPADARGQFSIDDFCDLPPRENIEAEIQAAERSLSAATREVEIRRAQLFDQIGLPEFDEAALQAVLARDLPELELAAVEQVQVMQPA